MSRWKVQLNPQAMATGAATLTIPSNLIPVSEPGAALINASIAFADANQAFDAAAILTNVTGVRVKKDGVPFMDFVPKTQLGAFVAALTRSHVDYLTGTRCAFTLPFNLFDEDVPERADICTAPLGAQLQIEIDTNGSWPASMFAYLTLTYCDSGDPKPMPNGKLKTPIVFYPQLLQQSLNIAASSNPGTRAITSPNMIRAFLLPQLGGNGGTTLLTGYQRWRVVLSNVQKFISYALPFATGDDFSDPTVATQANPFGSPAQNSIIAKLDGMMRAGANNSFLEAVSGTAALAADKFLMWELCANTR